MLPTAGVRLSYFLRIPNVGDRINPHLVTALTGESTRYVGRSAEPHLLAVGSIMASATPSSHVWGSGVMDPSKRMGKTIPTQVHAIRGALSHRALRNSGVLLRDIPFGDPGYLAPSLLGISRAPSPRFRLGLCPHYVDRQNPIVARLLAHEGVLDLDVHQPPEKFLRQMAECQTVVSTSLHGLVFAEALGIPNLWARLSEEIGGGDFKYLDWFSTTRRPQRAAHIVVPEDTVEDLIGRAELHDSTIDTQAVKDAFPHAHLDDLRRSAGTDLLPVSECRERPTPVFLISFNRGEMLEKAVAGIKAQSRPTDIVVHDNGSTDRLTLDVLKRMEESGAKVVRNPPIASPDDLNLVNKTVEDYFSTWAEPSRYIVSDCDIDLSVAAFNALDVYDGLLNIFRRAECVGPMLRIHDIPPDYPLYRRVMSRHIAQFWQHTPTIVKTDGSEAAIQEAQIDTTMAMHRAGDPFRRMKKGIRVYEPFEALHLDWYQTEAPRAYADVSASISHWGKFTKERWWARARLKKKDYIIVEKSADGRLELRKQKLSAPESKSIFARWF